MEIIRLVLARVGIEGRGVKEGYYYGLLKENEYSMKGVYRQEGEASMWCCLSTLEGSLSSKVYGLVWWIEPARLTAQ